MSGNRSNEALFDAVLDELFEDYVRSHIGTYIILGTLFLPGVVGNTNILHIYAQKTHKSSTSIFVMLLAAIDLTACAVYFPMTIIQLLIPYKSYKPFGPFCRIMAFMYVFMIATEGLALLSIAVEQYRRICEPSKRPINPRNAAFIVISILAVSVILSVPMPIMYDAVDYETAYPNITGYYCDVLPEFSGMPFERIYYGFAGFLVLVSCLVVPVLYALITRRLWRHQTEINKSSRQMSPETSQKATTRNNETNQSMNEGVEMLANQSTDGDPDILTNKSACGSDGANFHVMSTAADSEPESSVESEFTSTLLRSLDKGYKERKHVALKTKEKRKILQLKRPIYMFTAVAILYVLTFVPHPLIRVYERLHPAWFQGLTTSGKAGVLSTRGLLFLNNVINSYIYMIFDEAYRRELRRMYSQLRDIVLSWIRAVGLRINEIIERSSR